MNPRLRVFASTRGALALLAGLLVPAHTVDAQQRHPAVEVFGLTGGYFHGNLSLRHDWKPQYGGGILLPIGRNWAALFDATTSKVESYWQHDGCVADGIVYCGAAGAGPTDNHTRERRIALTPSLVRMWRRDRFSIYAGFGVGWEHERQRSRYRPIVARDDQGRPVLADEFKNVSATRTDAMLALRIGTIIGLTRKMVFRTDFALLPRYVDEKASKSLSAGIGYRF